MKHLFHTPYPLVLTASQTRRCEQYTMEHEPISSEELMERAGHTCADFIRQQLSERSIQDVRIFCGTGNNGGDGLVIARHLALLDPHPNVQVILCQSDTPHYTPETTANLNRWKEILETHANASLTLFNPDEPEIAPANALQVDALFGIGLNKPVGGIYAEAIQSLNASDAPTIAIDMPSGLFADTYTEPGENIVMAQITLAIQYPKPALFVPDNYPFCGEVVLLDIDMVPPPDLTCDREFLTCDTIRSLLTPRNPYAHKGTFGHGLLVAGSADMPGAAILAATAALRGGIGKITVHTAANAAAVLPFRLPEAILHRDANPHHVSDISWDTLPGDIRTLAIGPGLGRHPQTDNAIKEILDRVHTPIILDADALNMLADNKTWLAYLPPFSILTPHIREFERLAGSSANGLERIQQARDFAIRYQIVLILKGHHTVISMPDGKQFFNTTGNEGMGTAGSGDVLTGLLLALLCQGYSPEATALIGVFLHGLAGDLFAENSHPSALIASDLPNHFGQALRYILQSEKL